jgi:hypothetical protein
MYDVTQSQADLRDNDAHLRERGKRQGALDVALHAGSERGKQGGGQADSDHRSRQ